MAQSVLTNTSWSIAGRIVSGALGVVATGLLGRMLGVTGFGTYAVLLSIGALLQTGVDFGLYLTLTRELPKKSTEEKQEMFSLVSGLRVALSLLLFGGATILMTVFSGYRDLWIPFVVVGVGFLFQSQSQLLMGVYQTVGTVWRATIGDVVGRVVQVVMLFLASLIFANAGLLYAISAFVVSTAVSLLLHGALIGTIVPWRPVFNVRAWRQLLVESWPLAALLVVSAIYFRIDIVMLAWFRPGEEVGWYGLAYKVIESILFIPAAFGGILLPRLSALQGDSKKLTSLLGQALYVVGVIGVGVFVILVAGAQPIATLLAGSGFLPASSLIAILSIALLIMFFGNILGFALVAWHKQKFLLKVYCALAVFNVVGNMIAIPVLGAVGAAWTTVFTELFATLTTGLYLWNRLTIDMPWAALTKTVILGVLTYVCIRIGLMYTFPIVVLCAATVLYPLFLWVSGAVRPAYISILTTRHEEV